MPKRTEQKQPLVKGGDILQYDKLFPHITPIPRQPTKGFDIAAFSFVDLSDLSMLEGLNQLMVRYDYGGAMHEATVRLPLPFSAADLATAFHKLSQSIRKTISAPSRKHAAGAGKKLKA